MGSRFATRGGMARRKDTAIIFMEDTGRPSLLPGSSPSLPVRRLLAAALPIAALLGAGVASSTTLAPFSRAALVTGSAAVVHATAVSSVCRWNESHSLLVTDVTFRVHEVLKGEPAATVTVRVPGGQAGKLRVEVPGAAEFAPGTECVLVLARDARGHLWVSGQSAGRWDVQTDAHGVRVARGLALPAPVGGAPRAGGMAETAAPAPVESLADLLRDLRGLASGAANPGGR